MPNLTSKHLDTIIRQALKPAAEPKRAPIAHAPRPRIVLDIHRQDPGDDAQCITAGTLTVDQGSSTAILHACRRKHWSSTETAAVVEQVAGIRTLHITAHTQNAAEGTRRDLNQRWLSLDMANSGRFSDSVAELLRNP